MKSFLFSILLVGAIMGSAAATPASPPNIILILADDAAYGDLSCFGQKNFSTPHIDRLAREGCVFANAYAGGGWCAPAFHSSFQAQLSVSVWPARSALASMRFSPGASFTAFQTKTALPSLSRAPWEAPLTNSSAVLALE